MPTPLEVLCCYAREDQAMLEQLKKHLAPLQRQGQITIWSDTNIEAGAEWDRELHRHLERADIILLMISSDFMSSDYCYSTEMGRAIQRHNQGSAHVIPVLLRSTFWQNAPFAKLQMVPTNAEPVTNWPDRDKAFNNITEQINQVITGRKGQPNKPVPQSVSLPQSPTRVGASQVDISGEWISIALRRNFREFCSSIYLRQIDEMFLACGIQKAEVSPEILAQTSGERRTRVEEYYASLDWTKPADAQKFLDVISFALVQEYVPQDYKERLRQIYGRAGFQVDGDTIALPAHESKTGQSNTASSASQQRNISAVTRRDIMDKLRSWKVEGRLDLIEFLEMTWPNLASTPSLSAGMSLAYEISFASEQPVWDSSDDFFSYLFYDRLQLGSCDDNLFITFLTSCIHPLVRPDKKEVAELLSFFNEALRPDGYVLRPFSMQSGKPIYAAFTLGTKDEEYIVPRAMETVEQLARGFHSVVRKLSQRYNDRPALEIRDEYDVQDLFYALLTPFFEDIRPEEVAPSHAGGHGRIDFLIKAEQIVIEIKKTRPSLKVKALRDQLIVDKEIYRTHPHCRTFIAFVYDPDGHIDNPTGFEKDLSNVAGDMRVKVIVAPR